MFSGRGVGVREKAYTPPPPSLFRACANPLTTTLLPSMTPSSPLPLTLFAPPPPIVASTRNMSCPTKAERVTFIIHHCRYSSFKSQYIMDYSVIISDCHISVLYVFVMMIITFTLCKWPPPGNSCCIIYLAVTSSVYRFFLSETHIYCINIWITVFYVSFTFWCQTASFNLFVRELQHGL